jgi:3-dehydroquinate dehydratase-2
MRRTRNALSPLPGQTMPTIWVLQGPNLNLLGVRQPEIYGTTSAAELDQRLRAHARERGFTLEIHYTNFEGEMLELLHRAHFEGVNAIVLNPAGFTYAGYPLRDAMLAISVPVVEVHISNLHQRGINSITASAAAGVVMGFGLDGYPVALDAALGLIARRAGA